MEEASAYLDADEWQTFRRVTLPTIRLAVMGSALSGFTDQFGRDCRHLLLDLGRQNTLPLQIWTAPPRYNARSECRGDRDLRDLAGRDHRLVAGSWE